MTDSRLYLAVVHYPVYNKYREIITTSIVIHDIHDIARAGKTYGARAMYEVEPLPQEQEIALRIAQFWNEGFGREYNPNRAESLSLLHIVTHFEEAVAEIQHLEAEKPILVATSARTFANSVGYHAMGDKMRTGDHPYLLVFGTGFGLADEMMMQMDYVLDPIWGPTEFNHLSVRSAAAIILDRLLGRD
ncbi:MAG: RNA methyltransferase [Candidatus Cryosericum sp.]